MPSMFSSEDGDKTASDPNQSNVQNKSKCIWILFDEFVSHCVELSDSDEIPSLQQSGSLNNNEIEEKEDIQQLRVHLLGCHSEELSWFWVIVSAWFA